MQWAGHTFKNVPVLTSNGEYLVMETGRAIHAMYRRHRFKGNRGIWSQPVDKQGNLMSAYFGPIVFLFTGRMTDDGLTSLKNARILTQRLVGLNISGDAIDILLAQKDVYVLVNARSFGMSPDPMFPTWCGRIAKSIAGDLPIDDIYYQGAMMPIEGSKLNDGSYVTMFRPHDLERRDESLIFSAKVRRPLHSKWKIEQTIDGSNYHPLNMPVHFQTRGNLPDGLKMLLDSNPENLDDACFAAALAVKDIGGTKEDALCLVNTLRTIETLSPARKIRTLDRAFRQPYHFGYRTFTKKFPGLTTPIQEEKSGFVIFERSWLKRLIDANAPYTAYKLLFELLLEHHAYPKPELSLPKGWSQKLMKQALSVLTNLGIVACSNGDVHLCTNFIERKKAYVRTQADYLQKAVSSKNAIRLFAALLASSLHKKDGHWTTVKVETLSEKLSVSVRTVYEYLRSLRNTGIPISKKLSIEFPILQSENEANAPVHKENEGINESIQIDLIKKIRTSCFSEVAARSCKPKTFAESNICGEVLRTNLDCRKETRSLCTVGKHPLRRRRSAGVIGPLPPCESRRYRSYSYG